MRYAFSNVLFYFFTHACCSGVIRGFCHDDFLESGDYSELFLQRLGGLARSLAGTRVGAGTLTADRQAFAMTQAAVRAKIHQSLEKQQQNTAQGAGGGGRAGGGARRRERGGGRGRGRGGGRNAGR